MARRLDESPQPFVALDGEGIANKYVLLGSSIGESIKRRNGLATEEIFEWLFALRRLANGAFDREPAFVGFGTTYDVNHWLRDLDDATLKLVLAKEKEEYVPWRKWELLYIPKKLIKIRKKGTREEFKWFDTISFFQCSFIKALEKMAISVPAVIVAGKEKRREFAWKDIAKIARYNAKECDLLVAMMTKMDELLRARGLHLRSWHGPGAIASLLLGKRHMDIKTDFPRQSVDHMPMGLADAVDRAYFGGRIETFTIGTVKQVSSYDINSAYPLACTALPVLPPWDEWERDQRPKRKRIEESAFGLWRVKWDVGAARICPFPWRDEATNRIYYPQNGEGWYHSTEVLAALDRFGKAITLLDGWYVSEALPSKFADWIPRLYALRLALKAAGDMSEIVLKLALNSLYGKLAQREGHAPFLCLAWAGAITAATRARLLSTTARNEDDILAFATDGVLSRKSLGLSASKALGGWSVESYDSATLVMSGFYSLKKGRKRVKVASRGVNAKIKWASLIRQLNTKGKVTFPIRVFVTHALAMARHHQYGDKRLWFVDDKKSLSPQSALKRVYPRMPKRFDLDSEESTSVRCDGSLSAPSRMNYEDAFRDALEAFRLEEGD